MQQKNQTFDIVVIGGGPGGYPAAIRAAQQGRKVALVESKDLGGTCLNVGCIPTKTLLASAEELQRVRNAEKMGILTGGVSFDFAKMSARKDDVVLKIRKSLEGLIASNQITLFRGTGKLLSPTEVQVSGQDNALLKTEKIIIATGSRPRDLPNFRFDHERILSSDSILALKKLPKSLIIIGGGVIGCEFASLYNDLGVEVTILEVLPDIIPMEANNLSVHLTRDFKKRGIKIETAVSVESAVSSKEGVKVKLANGKEHVADLLLVSVGRAFNTSNIGLDKAGVKVDEKGAIPVNEKMETNVPGIYAIGDITGRWQLAHVASHQGLVAADNALGKPAQMHYNAVPSVIYTDPEIASVGMTLDQAIKNGHEATLGSFPFNALGKSQAALQTEGFAQIVVDKRTGQILGAQVLGHEASSLISEMTIAIANELTVESITETIHAHPTIAEAWLEAALLANEMPLHWPPKKRG